MSVSRASKIRFGRVGIVLLLLLMLEVIVRAGWVSVLILSPPSTIFLKVWEDLRGAELWTSLRTTAMEFFFAFVLSFIVGVPCGILFYRFRLLASAIEPLLLAFYAAPTFLLYPVFLTLFGLGSATVISMAVVLGAIPIIVNVNIGLSGVEPMFTKVGRSLQASWWQMFWKIMLPAATPAIFTGLRLGFTYALVGVIAVEFLTFSGGIGKMVSGRYFIFDTEGLFSGIVFVIIIAVLMNHLLRRAENRIRARWA